ncbi:hypothetical protein EJB05_09589 [Eragrostis curvula]|uniref:Uncharacterized protein n=1 Tax=Eragrostis curvula TaxID=38414 RepID=A0A5J9W5E5_9POAL|nr:hypothetical protein EJB05_09589 [Eragrostis curvula]
MLLCLLPLLPSPTPSVAPLYRCLHRLTLGWLPHSDKLDNLVFNAGFDICEVASIRSGQCCKSLVKHSGHNPSMADD